MLTYATADELGGYMTELPDHPERYIAAASRLVRNATRAAVYPVDAAGKPTDPWHIDAMCEAVCWTVAEWVAAGLDPGAGRAGQGAAVVSSSIAGASVTYDAASQREAETASLEHLGTLARTALADAGLLTAGLRT